MDGRCWHNAVDKSTGNSSLGSDTSSVSGAENSEKVETDTDEDKFDEGMESWLEWIKLATNIAEEHL